MTTAQAPDAVEAALARLGALHPKLIDLSLDRIHRLLAKLNHPERALPPVVHIAGTNGKGSTLAFLNAMADAAGIPDHFMADRQDEPPQEREALDALFADDKPPQP